MYRKDAIDKKNPLDFYISKELAISLFKSNCFYCGIQPTQIFNDASFYGYCKYNGIDRIDNNVGYIENNVVSCCNTCNMAKRAMDINEFINQIRNINNHGNKKIALENHFLTLTNTDFKNCVVIQYKRDAKKDNREWSLTDAYATQLFRSLCFYCGCSPYSVNKERKLYFTYNGIDRVDNKYGYTIENSVPCCVRCNFSKRGLKLDEFHCWSKRAFNYLNLDKTPILLSI